MMFKRFFLRSWLFMTLLPTILFSLLIIAAPIKAASGDIITVSSIAELDNALDTATGGEIIRLNNGNYGAYDINDRTFSSYITITSANEQGGALFSNIEFNRSSYVRITNVTIVVQAREGVGIFDNSHHIQVLDSEIYGINQFNRNTPDYTQVSTLYGINTNSSNNLLIQNNDVHDIKSSAYLFTNTNNSTIKGNQCDWVASDCYKLAGVDSMLFENNFGARNIHSSPTAHIDFVQGQGTVSNSRFIGNVALAANKSFQGLFFDDATFTNLVFENNVIHTSSIRGISVSSPSSGTVSSGIEARFNTVLRPAGSQKASLILIPSGSINENNIVSNNVTKNQDRFLGNNIVAQWDDSDDIAHYSLYYEDVMKTTGVTIDDFKPIENSPADGQKGAFARINELINGSPPEPEPTNNNDLIVIPMKNGKAAIVPL